MQLFGFPIKFTKKPSFMLCCQFRGKLYGRALLAINRVRISVATDARNLIMPNDGVIFM